MWSNCSLIVINYHRVILFIVTRIVMVTLCSLQLWSITKTYMDGNTISKVDLSFPDYLTLPSVSLCLNFLDTLNTSAIVSVSPSLAHIFEASQVYAEDHVTRHNHLIELYEFLGNQSLKELKNLMKTQLDSLLEDITPTQLEPDDGSSVTCDLVRYLHEPHFCYTITCTNGETGEPATYPRSTIFEPRYGGRMLTIGLNWSVVQPISRSASLLFTTSGSRVGGSYYSSYSVDLSSAPSTFIVTYSMIRNNLASVSTETKCTPEGPPSEGKGDQIIRFNYCTNQRSRSTLGTSFYGTIQRLDDLTLEDLKPGYNQYYREFLTPNLTQRQIDRSIFQDIRSACSEQVTSPNCVTEIYSPFGDKFAEKDKNDFTIVINVPTVPFENNEFFLEVALLDYLIYISSSLSFWFGISIISIVNRASSSFIKYLDSRRSKVKSINSLAEQQLIRRKRLAIKHKVPDRVGQSRVLSKFNSLNKHLGDSYNYLTYHKQISPVHIKY